MIVRCGRCESNFDVAGPGRYPCPACGTPNDVKVDGRGPSDEGLIAPPPAPEPAAPSPRAECGECGFSFIVGAVANAPCPNCGATVTVAGPEEST